jgi:hypothetical protein
MRNIFVGPDLVVVDRDTLELRVWFIGLQELLTAKDIECTTTQT